MQAQGDPIVLVTLQKINNLNIFKSLNILRLFGEIIMIDSL